MHKIRQFKYPSFAYLVTDPAGGPAGEPRLSIPELILPQKLTASVRATQTSLHKMKLMLISKMFQNTGGADVAEIICKNPNGHNHKTDNEEWTWKQWTSTYSSSVQTQKM